MVHNAQLDLNQLRHWNIVVDEAALPSELYAAAEFQDFFQRASGSALPVVRSAANAAAHVFIGPGAAQQAGSIELDDSSFGEEGFRIVIRPDCVVIAGGRPRGTLYGVYTFLEDYLGVRFLTHDHTHVPALDPQCRVSCVERCVRPTFEFRWPFYFITNNDPVLATRQRTNTVQREPAQIVKPFMRKPPVGQDGWPCNHADPKFGGVSRLEIVGHSIQWLLPADEFGRQHPEYFCEIDGQRRALETLDSAERLQPCLTNADVLEIVTQRVIKQIEAQPERKLIVVGQADNSHYCRCAKCRAIDEAEGTPMGSLLTFVNAIAEQVSRRYPQVQVGTLAYQYSRKPPRTIQAQQNVYVQLCSIECCNLHALDEPGCPLNTPFCDDLRGWGQIARQVGVWTYVTNFVSFQTPFPNLRALERNLRFFAANGVKALFMQGATCTPVSEFSELRNYLLSALLWDPSRHARRLMQEFLELHYRKAAGPILSYIDGLHERLLAKHVHYPCHCSNEHVGIDAAFIAWELENFEAVIAAETGEPWRSRVEKVALGLLRAALDPLFFAKGPLPAAQAQRLVPIANRFFALCRKVGATRVREPQLRDWTVIASQNDQIGKTIEKIADVTGLKLSVK